MQRILPFLGKTMAVVLYSSFCALSRWFLESTLQAGFHSILGQDAFGLLVHPFPGRKSRVGDDQTAGEK